jgi:hypothetical protein
VQPSGHHDGFRPKFLDNDRVAVEIRQVGGVDHRKAYDIEVACPKVVSESLLRHAKAPYAGGDLFGLIDAGSDAVQNGNCESTLAEGGGYITEP